MKEKNDKIKESIEEYSKYFQDDLNAIKTELDKSNEYSEIIDREIEKFTKNNLHVTQGSQHYLIQHLANAIQLQTQRQGLRKDRVSIMKLILDYALKVSKDEDEDAPSELRQKIEELIKKDRETSIKEEPVATNETDLDLKIDAALKKKKD